MPLPGICGNKKPLFTDKGCRIYCDNSAVWCDNCYLKKNLEVLMYERINARLSQPLSEFVERMVGKSGLYETPSEYVRDLIRRDMERRDGQLLQDAILTGYQDLATGRVFASSGDFKADMAMLELKESNGWQ
jgi:antitoxin ParD1/3/4